MKKKIECYLLIKEIELNTFKTTYVESIYNLLAKNQNANNAIMMKKYMKNQFEFFGIKAPLRRNLTKQIVDKHGIPDELKFKQVILELWSLPQRELQCVAMNLIDIRQKKKGIDIALTEHMITTKSWWDTVDHLAINHAGAFFVQNPILIDKVTNLWIESNDIWLKRSALLFQLKYKERTDVELLFNHIKKCCHTKEFFIDKAIGWALRKYSKLEPKLVLEFIENHELSSLSRREALKHIEKNLKIQIHSQN
ncbi:DNA alkylation repair protein [Bacillus wiedmannii]|uniref:DNA alkylation repair protein n=1 Tax=Bacillus wiedmannii TaxID=1890302 RepID=UPI00211D4945|nr:DNA alkylation repair protein [Bacillus wiedmannii]